MMLDELKNLFLTVAHRLSLIDIVLFLIVFFVFVLLYLLGIFWRSKRFLSNSFILLSFVVLLSIPFVIKYMGQQYIYKVELSYNRAFALHYTDAFFIDVNVKNIGKKTINKCFVKLDIFRLQDGWKDYLKNFFYPEKTFDYTIKKKIIHNQTEHLMVMFDDFYYRNNPYKITIDCS